MKLPIPLILLSCGFSFAMAQPNSESNVKEDIKALRAEVRSLNVRLERLERQLHSQPTQAASSSPAPLVSWHQPSNWYKVQAGMSRSQVESLLGKPSRVDRDVISYVTLIYRGQRSGSGHISGNVQLDPNDRVVEINVPVFYSPGN